MDHERLMERAREAWRTAAPSEGEIQRGAERVGRRLTARRRQFPRRQMLVAVGACAAFLAALAYAGSQKWIEPARSPHLGPQPTAAPSGVEIAVPKADPKNGPPMLAPEPAPTSQPIDEAATPLPDSVAPGASDSPVPSTGTRKGAPINDDTARPTPSWAEVSEALSGGDEKHAQSLLTDLSRRGQNADDRAKAKLGLAQLESSHGNCARARVLALQVASVQGIELKTVRRALELATHCTQ